MKVPAVLNRRKKQAQKIRPEDVIREQLAKAYALHPGHLMPTAIIAALSDAGFRIISDDDYDREIALAYQAGADSAAEG